MSHKLKKLFNSIINDNINNNSDSENNNNNNDDYKLILNMDDLIKGSHIRFKISSKTIYSGFFIMCKKSLIRDYNMIVVKMSNIENNITTKKDYNTLEIPFYKYKVYQKDLQNIKKKSVFKNKEIRNQYLNNLSKYINNTTSNFDNNNKL